MSDEREQEPGGESRPSGAAARRERRASARPAARRAREGRAAESGATSPSATRSGSATTESKGRPTPSRDDRQGRVSPFRKIGRFLREVVAELRKVNWPQRRQLLTYTVVVLVFVSIMVAMVSGLDLLFTKGVLGVFG